MDIEIRQWFLTRDEHIP